MVTFGKRRGSVLTYSLVWLLPVARSSGKAGAQILSACSTGTVPGTEDAFSKCCTNERPVHNHSFKPKPKPLEMYQKND